MTNLIDSRLMAHIEEILEFAKDKGAFFKGELEKVEDARDGAYDYYEGLVDGYGIMETKIQTVYNRALYEMRQDGEDTMWSCPKCNAVILYWQEAHHKATGCVPFHLGGI